MTLFNIDYIPEKSGQTSHSGEMIRYEGVQIIGKFANWNSDNSPNVGLAIINANGEHRRMRYDGVVQIQAIWACGGRVCAPFFNLN